MEMEEATYENNIREDVSKVGKGDLMAPYFHEDDAEELQETDTSGKICEEKNYL